MSARLVTVFGGSGFVGRHVVRRLAARGDRVNVAVRRPERAKFLKPMGAVGQVTPIPTDITNPASVSAAVQGADIVINLVGILFESGRQRFASVQHHGAERIADAARAVGASAMVHLSAIGADRDSGAAYARSKAAGEEAVLATFPDATVLRPSIVFGPEDSFFNRFAGMAVNFPALPLIGGGETRFQPVYVGDVADAAIAALESPKHAGRTYELGGPRVYTFRALMELILAETRRRRVLVPIPFALASLKASVLELLPNPMLTRDQVELLKRDNVVAEGVLTLADLGIAPTACEIILPTYLDRFRPGGRYSPAAAA